MKGLSIFFLTLLLLAACKSEDDGYDTDGNSITIVRQDLTFDPQGRTGSLEVRADGAVSVLSSSDWCTAVVNGSVINVTVTDNTNIEGRVAILTLKSGTSTLKVPVQQRGMAIATLPFNRLHAENAGSTKKYLLQHDFEAILTTEEDWIHSEMKGDSLILKIDPNTTSQIRRGELAFSCGGIKDTLRIVQYDIQKNIVGAYYFGGDFSGSPYGVSFELYKEKGVYYMDWSSHENWEGAIFPVEFNEETCALTIPSAMEFYFNNGDWERGYFYDTSGRVASSPAVSMTAYLYSNPMLSNATYGTLEENGSWPDHTINGFVLRMARLGGLLTQTVFTLTDVYVMRVGPRGSQNKDSK